MAKRRLTTKTRALLQCAQEGILNDILRAGMLAGDAQRQAIDRLGVRAINGGECALAAFDCAAKQQVLVFMTGGG
jgi:hypothetical protein